MKNLVFQVQHLERNPSYMPTWQSIFFIQPGVQDMSIISCAHKVAVK